MTDLEAKIYRFLVANYLQHADSRQQAMGLHYTVGSTAHLARDLASFLTLNGHVEPTRNGKPCGRAPEPKPS